MFLFQMEGDATRRLRLANMAERVLHRLGDSAQQIWSYDEIKSSLLRGARLMAQRHVMWDQVYLENLAAGFSHTGEFEEEFLTINYGRANYTAEFEADYIDDDFVEVDNSRRANHTSPGDIHHLVEGGASTLGDATVELPETLVEIERATNDNRAVDATRVRRVQGYDARYEVTQGEVIAYTWEKDGPHTLRKIRVPNAQADVYEYNGSWGLLRDATDLETGESVEGTWGVLRIVAGHHPIGSTEGWGIPRRAYQDDDNFRVDHWRQFVVDDDTTGSELPDRYFKYLTDFAQWRALFRNGAGQDLRLAELYKIKWERGLDRITRRLQRKDKERQGILGGGNVGRRGSAPPAPKLPWQYGAQLR